MKQEFVNRDSGEAWLGSIVLIVSNALDLPPIRLTARAARPPVDAAPAAIQAAVAMHAGHMVGTRLRKVMDTIHMINKIQTGTPFGSV
jgi:hypothetical protein